MCGLAGIVRFDDTPIDPNRLERFLPYLTPRGPDDHGVQIDPTGRCGMVHTRLSVLDLMSGHQPMQAAATDKRGPVSVVFNGEIYNHRTLRKKLTRLGYQFTTDHCDTEVLLFGYQEWGTELPKHLHGMFAFAIWDTQDQSLFMCRDRAGQKPLYFCQTENQLVYASLVGAILAGLDSSPRINQNALSHFLTLGYSGTELLFEGIEELEPAHWMLIDRGGNRVKRERYWQPPPLSRTSTRLGAVEATHELLEEAIISRLDADVPLGCFLSGGIDSSLIAAIAQKHMGSERRLQTFSVSMPDVAYDEGPYARRVAEHIGAEHHELAAQPDVETDLPRLIATLGEPFIDSSLLPTFWLSKATRQHVTVALSGEGGDELFGGYDRYRALRLLAKYHWWIRFLPVKHLKEPDGKAFTTRLRRLVRAAKNPNAGLQYLELMRLFTPKQLGQLGFTALPLDRPPGWKGEKDPAEAARRWDLFNYLPYDLLRKMDRASMSVALEVRCPMLDTQLCDLAGHLPLHVIMPGGRPKGLLRQVAAQYLPNDIIRRKKMGFAVPIGGWFKTSLRSMLHDHLLSTNALDALGCHRAGLERMIDEHMKDKMDHTHRLFALLTLVMWLEWRRDPIAPDWSK